MSKCRSTLQQYFLSVKRSGKQHKISYQLLSTSWGGWDEGFVEYKLTCHWKQWRALASRLRQVKMLEILVHSSIRWLAQAPLHLELRADEQTHLKSRIFDQRSARRQEQRYVEYFGLPERVRQKNLKIFHARSSKRGKRPHDHRPQLHVLHRLRNVQS